MNSLIIATFIMMVMALFLLLSVLLRMAIRLDLYEQQHEQIIRRLTALPKLIDERAVDVSEAIELVLKAERQSEVKIWGGAIHNASLPQEQPMHKRPTDSRGRFVKAKPICE